jgi:hypothetical protein
LRSRKTKDHVEELRIRSMYGYIYGYISRRRMDRLLAICDAFEREAFLPDRAAQVEINEEAKLDGGVLTKQVRRAMLKVLAGNPSPTRRKKNGG